MVVGLEFRIVGIGIGLYWFRSFIFYLRRKVWKDGRVSSSFGDILRFGDFEWYFTRAWIGVEGGDWRRIN